MVQSALTSLKKAHKSTRKGTSFIPSSESTWVQPVQTAYANAPANARPHVIVNALANAEFRVPVNAPVNAKAKVTNHAVPYLLKTTHLLK
jgi:hypothetical protein